MTATESRIMVDSAARYSDQNPPAGLNLGSLARSAVHHQAA
ncbi:hypothetical protein ACIP4W_15345 [Streptomyces sp. NPDC088846]